MNTRSKHFLTALALSVGSFAAVPAVAQFDSGSDGSDGALSVTLDTTLPLPPDGIFHFTTVQVNAGTTLSFTKNALNTPVVFLATGDIVIEGRVDLSGENGSLGAVFAEPGRGGPGGHDGGWGGPVPGPGHGPGGGEGGLLRTGPCSGGVGGGAYRTRGINMDPVSTGRTYGNALNLPLVGGSGGGGTTFWVFDYRGGGGGGGAFLAASNTSISVDAPGSIDASGGVGGVGCNPGSGGAIRLVSPQVSGDGTLDVGSLGGFGRIRIDTIDRSNIGFALFDAASTTIGSVLLVGLNPTPELRIVSLAGSAISESETMPVEVILPMGSATTQPVTVRGTGFSGLVPVTVAVLPEAGTRAEVEVELDFDAGDPAEATAMIELAPNIVHHVQAWIR